VVTLKLERRMSEGKPIRQEKTEEREKADGNTRAGQRGEYLSSLQADNRGVSIDRKIIEWLEKRSETGKVRRKHKRENKEIGKRRLKMSRSEEPRGILAMT
jgi:hypothetical protein